MSSVRVTPAELPSAVVERHEFTPETNARERPRDQGEMRMRPRFRSVPDLCNVLWILPLQSQFDAFDSWYEDTLQAGSLEFDVRVQDRGTRLHRRWFTAQFVGDYQCEVIAPLIYRVSATLRLIDDLGTLRIPPGIESTIGLRFGLTAQTAAPSLAATIGISFQLQAVMPAPMLQASIGVSFGLTWAEGGGPTPPSDAVRETDAGDARETDAGDARETD